MISRGLLQSKLRTLFSKNQPFEQFCREFSNIYFSTVVNTATDLPQSSDTAILNVSILNNLLSNGLKNNEYGFYNSVSNLWMGANFSILSPSVPSNVKVSSIVTYSGTPFRISKSESRSVNEIANELASKLTSHVKSIQGIITEVNASGTTITLPMNIT